MVFDGLKPISVKILAIVVGLFFLIFGTTWLGKFDLTIYTKAFVMVVLALIIGIELGVKLKTNLSSLKKFGLQQYLGVAIAGLLLVGGLMALFGVTLTSLDTLTNFFIGIGSGWIILEAWI